MNFALIPHQDSAENLIYEWDYMSISTVIMSLIELTLVTSKIYHFKNI